MPTSTAADRGRIKRTLIKRCLKPIVNEEDRTGTFALVALAAFPVMIAAIRYFSDLGWWATMGGAVGGEFLVFALFGLRVESGERSCLEKAWENFDKYYPHRNPNRPAAVQILRELAQTGADARSKAATRLLSEIGEDVLHNQSTEEQLEKGLKPLQVPRQKKRAGPALVKVADEWPKVSPSISDQPTMKQKRRARQFDYIPLDPQDGDDPG